MLKIVTFVIALQLFFDNCPFGVDCMPKSAERSLEGTNNTEDGEIFPLGNIGMHDDFTFAGCISAADDGEECVTYHCRGLCHDKVCYCQDKKN
ncbi:uncharacterized protein LOC144148716 isoform X2 [Haemaphysalis longicornis]